LSDDYALIDYLLANCVATETMVLLE